MDVTQTRAAIIAHLETALHLAEQIKDAITAHLIERALDEARGKFSGKPPVEEMH
jgi:hypothetical protein